MTQEALRMAFEAMNAMLTHMGMDEDEWNKVTFDQMRQAIKAAEEALAHCPDCGQLLGDAGHIHTCSPQRTEQSKACVYCGQLVAKEKNT